MVPEGYPDADHEESSVGLAELATQNLYGQQTAGSGLELAYHGQVMLHAVVIA